MRGSLIVLILFFNTSLAQTLRAPNFEANAADQLDHSKQACGPTCLLNQLRFGNSQLQSAEGRIPVEGDTRKLRWIIGRYGIKLSGNIGGQRRWSPSTGVNVADLQDMANEMAAELRSSKITTKHLKRKDGDRGQELLKRSHQLIKKSLKKGVPPILQVRRFVERHYPTVGRKIWMGVHGHFVVIIGVEKSLGKDATSFTVTYADPWRGGKFQGKLKIPDKRYYANNPSADKSGDYHVTPYLEVDFPRSSIGVEQIRKGESSQLTCPNLLGRF